MQSPGHGRRTGGRSVRLSPAQATSSEPGVVEERAARRGRRAEQCRRLRDGQRARAELVLHVERSGHALRALDLVAAELTHRAGRSATTRLRRHADLVDGVAAVLRTGGYGAADLGPDVA